MDSWPAMCQVLIGSYISKESKVGGRYKQSEADEDTATVNDGSKKKKLKVHTWPSFLLVMAKFCLEDGVHSDLSGYFRKRIIHLDCQETVNIETYFLFLPVCQAISTCRKTHFYLCIFIVLFNVCQRVQSSE